MRLAPRSQAVPLRVATRAWFLISLQTFGGPAGQIAVMQRTLVDERRWIGQRRFLHALNYCMLLPGPEAQQLAIYIGWLLNGWLAAGWSRACSSCCPAWSPCSRSRSSTSVTATPTAGHRLFARARSGGARDRGPGGGPGRRAALHTRRSSRSPSARSSRCALRACRSRSSSLVAGVVGWSLGRWRAGTDATAPIGQSAEGPAPPLIPDDALHPERPSWRRALAILAVGLVVWVTPVLLALALTGAALGLHRPGRVLPAAWRW